MPELTKEVREGLGHMAHSIIMEEPIPAEYARPLLEYFTLMEQERKQAVEYEKAIRHSESMILQDNRALSDAYVRLRALIPGAFETSTAPKPRSIWDLAESCLKDLREKAGLPREAYEKG